MGLSGALVMSQAGGDVVPALDAQEADGRVAQSGHGLWGVAGADLGGVFVVSRIADPVESVLDAPVTLDPGCEGRWWCRCVVGGGDRVDDLDR